MQLVDDAEIGDQSAQLGGRAELQFGPRVDIKRLVETVGMDPQEVAVGAAFVQYDAPRDAGGVAVAEQLLADEAERAVIGGVLQMLENVGYPLLCRRIDGPIAGQIQPVE